jgi:hypothetical protein
VAFGLSDLFPYSKAPMIDSITLSALDGGSSCVIARNDAPLKSMLAKKALPSQRRTLRRLPQ